MNFKELTDKKFGFLVSEYGYEATEPTRGSHANMAFIRDYRRGRLLVSVVFRDFDSRTNPWVVYFQNDFDPECRVHSSVEQSIYSLMEFGGVSTNRLPADAISSGAYTPDSIADYLAGLLRTYGRAVLEGDYAGFPDQVYVLERVWAHGGGLRRNFVGVYSTLDTMKQAIAKVRATRLFSQDLRGFEACRMQVDGPGFGTSDD